MKRYISLLIMAICFTASYAQFSVGIRDNRYAFVQYLLDSHYTFKIEQSIFSEKIGFQTLRAYAGYQSSIHDAIDYMVEAYFGATYNRSYSTAGGIISAKYVFINRLGIKASLNPHYDSTLGYSTCFLAGAFVGLSKEIDLIAAYTTIPEFRMSEKRILMGFDFHVSRLTVSPHVSIAAGSNHKAKNLRVLVSFSYCF